MPCSCSLHALLRWQLPLMPNVAAAEAAAEVEVVAVEEAAVAGVGVAVALRRAAT